MKKITIYTAALIMAFTCKLHAQVGDGTTAPDFTFTDLNGNSQNLYTYLNQGKYVALDVSATWCGPCWQYHTQVKTMEDIYNTHDTPGDNKWKVLWVEGDKSTTDADVKGTGTNTKGDWTKNTPFPIMNPASGTDLTNFMKGFNIKFYPTLYIICPNKKIYGDRLNDASYPWPDLAVWESLTSKCGVTGIDNADDKTPLTIYPNPVNSLSGNVGLYFNLNNPGNIQLQVISAIGQLVDNKYFNDLPAGDQSLKYSVAGLAPGIYNFNVMAENSRLVSVKVAVE